MKKIAVITGAFHVEGLKSLSAMSETEIKQLREVETNYTLMPYSYYRLSKISGYGAGNNRGVEYAFNNYNFDYIVISNADIIIEDLKLSNVKKYGDKTGDMFIQFKGRNGGPGEIYQYFDVPISLWRRFVSAPSKGHFFYVNVRSKFKYRITYS